MSDAVRRHYELYPYPHYPLFASLSRSDTYANNLSALWSRFNGTLPPPEARILIAGCGSFSPYPFALANPQSGIVALDLSERNLRRARLHCLLHRLGNVEFRRGDLCDPRAAEGSFALIDAFGVLHHLDDPLAGLRALETRLVEGGILRIMVYSRYTRREEESIRRALRLLRVRDPEEARRLMRRAERGSRLRSFIDASAEVSDRSGLADALLHPCVHTYRIDDLMQMVRSTGLEPLLFAHRGALADVDDEVSRIRAMEAQKHAPGNFVLFLGKEVRGRCAADETAHPSYLLLNPCLESAVSILRLRPRRVPGRLGHQNPPLDGEARRFLRRFRTPVPAASLTEGERTTAAKYCESLFLLRYSKG